MVNSNSLSNTVRPYINISKFDSRERAVKTHFKTRLFDHSLLSHCWSELATAKVKLFFCSMQLTLLNLKLKNFYAFATTECSRLFLWEVAVNLYILLFMFFASQVEEQLIGIYECKEDLRSY